MESGAGNWIVVDSDTTNTWTLNTEAAYSPTHAWSDSPGGNYSNNTDSSLALSHDIDLSSYSGPVTFYFNITGFIESSFDYLYVDISADSGATWTTYGYLYGDWTGGWYYLTGDISSAFKTAHFRLRFRLVTDSSITYDGLYIDDVGIYSCQQSDNYAFMAGTSMATPHVTGAVGVLAAYYPGDDVQTRKSRILCGVDQKPAFAGKMVTGGRLNLYNSFTCNDPPVILSIAPTCVAYSEISSTTVNIYGSNFENGASVTVGGIPAAQTSVLSADHIQIKLPALSNGTC